MSAQVSFTLRGRNPDVLTCIANLSNDEVFTPPEFANRMLDTLAEAWAAANRTAVLEADGSRATWSYDAAKQLLAENRTAGDRCFDRIVSRANSR